MGKVFHLVLIFVKWKMIINCTLKKLVFLVINNYLRNSRPRMKTLIYTIILVCTICGNSLRAQLSDSSKKAIPGFYQKDAKRIALEARPRQAAIQSALIPGLGQYKNKGFLWYLKIPAMYVGMAIFASQTKFYNSKYQYYLKQAQLKQVDNINEMATELRKTPLLALQDAYETNQRNKQLSIAGGIAIYGLNILDAYISGKFLRYDISDDLVVKFSSSPPNQQLAIKSEFTPMAVINLKYSFAKNQ